jgi:hypothetical protein
MSEARPLSATDLRLILSRYFNLEELRNICLDIGVDYDDLGGEGKSGKARELVLAVQRHGRLAALELIVRRLRPTLDTIYSPERVEELQHSILADSGPQVRDAFVEFTQQIDAYLNEFNLLHEKLQEWKEVHNLLQDLQNNFAPCRSYIYALPRLRGNSEQVQRDRERMLYEVEVEWRPCKRVFIRLEDLARNIVLIGEPYNAETKAGPDWFVILNDLARQIDKTIFESDILALTENLSAFGDRTNQYLYLADKTLRNVVGDINQLPRPRPAFNL